MVGLDWAEPMMLLLLHFTCLCIFHAYVPSFLYILILNCLVLFCLSLSFSLFLSLVALWHLNENPLRLGTLFVPRHLLLLPPLILLHLKSSFVMIKPVTNFSDTGLPTVIYSRGWESLCGIPVTCPSVIIQAFYSNMHGFDYTIPYFITRV